MPDGEHEQPSSSKRRESGGESVAEIRSRLRQFEDYNMALALQEQEFSNHYHRNRTERRTMGVDSKVSKEQQMEEQKRALELHLARASEIAKRDEELAHQLQRQLQEEERRLQLSDEELARRLQQEEVPGTSTSGRQERNSIMIEPITHFLATPNNTPSQLTLLSGGGAGDDAEFARSLQERYYQRFSQKPNRHLDESTQNEVNILVATNIVPAPSTLPQQLPPLPNYEQCVGNTMATRNTTKLHSEEINNNARQTDEDRSIFEANRRNIANQLRLAPPNSSGDLREERGSDRAKPTDNPFFNKCPVNRLNGHTAHATTTLEISNLHPTNPFLQDLIELSEEGRKSPIRRDRTADGSKKE